MKRRVIILTLSFLILSVPVLAQDTDWRAVTPAELLMQTPKVDPTADAEAIFWETRLDDKKEDKLIFTHYVRAKIFTEKGVERFSKMDIPYAKGRTIDGIAARVTKPDGTSIELKPTDIIDHEIVKAGKTKVQAKSFAIPNVAVGVIVEYQYNETVKHDSANDERLEFQRDIPIERMSYYIRPAKGATLKAEYFNMKGTVFVTDADGFSVATMNDVPAYKEEPYMPPDEEVRPWAYLIYSNFLQLSWFGAGTGWSIAFVGLTKTTKDIQQKADELAAGAANDDERLKRLYAFVQKEIHNTTYDRSLSEEQREKAAVKSPDEALRKQTGSTEFIDLLFASLAKAEGFEVGLVMSGNRAENFFSRNEFPSPRFLHPASVAVKVGNGRKYFNPGTPYLPYGETQWYEERVSAVVIGDKGGDWTVTPMSTIEQANTKRTGTFDLQDDGTLTGKVRVEYSGHEASALRGDGYFASPNKREDDYKAAIRARLSAAEITNMSIENFDDNEKPLVYSYDVKVPNYAQKTGKRLIFQPGFFEHGIDPKFTSTTRINSVYFSYPWSENDQIEIRLPKNYIGETIESPPKIADPQEIGSLDISVSTGKENNLLRYDRVFHFGKDGKIIFPVQFYKQLKNLFDRFNESDSQTVILKQREISSETK